MMGICSLMFIVCFFNSFSFLVTSSTVVDSIRPSNFMRENTTLVSKEGNFELGFFSPGNSKNRYLGIWYKNIPVQTFIWVANRCKPINDSSGSLTINDKGELVLLGQNQSVMWSTNSLKPAQQPLVQLLDNGNLVLRDEKDENTENYLWESFDYPTDTTVPGMKLGWDLRRNLTRRLAAWKSFDDPCNGDFTYGIELNQQQHTYPEPMILKGSSKFYRTGPWNGISFSGSPDLRPNPLFDYAFVYNDDEVYYIYYLKDKSVISRIVMNQTTSVRQRMVWIQAERIWKPYNSVPRDQCDNYGFCGPNSECVITNNPVCQCLKGFKPKDEENWKAMYWSEGCVRDSPPNNCHEKAKDGFLRFSGLKVPDTQYTWVNKSVNLRECRANCLSNCSCTAYTNSDIKQGIGCVLWFGDLFDIRQFSSGGQDLFIRVSASEIEKARVGRKVKKAVLVLAIIVALVGGLILVGFYIRRRHNLFEENAETNVIINRDECQEDDLELPLFSLHTIRTATNNFSQNSKLGEGGFGPVYRGMLEGGQEFAVKRLSMWSGQGDNEFKNEVKLIARLQHRNLVKILGCCIQGHEKLLIYEYMPNKSLDYFIFDQRQGRMLDWPKRFQIICGIAKGLLYLHHDSRLRIIHRDLKASNVLLDEEMNPKISDFGLARTFGGDQLEGNTSKVVGTYGYMAPEYAFDGLFSIKSDVFSFGILLLEIISGKRSRGYYYENNGLTLIGFAWTLMKEGKANKLIDKCLRDSYENSEEALRCIHIGLLCVQQSPIDRPNMSSVVVMLSGESVLPQPKPPGYFSETDMLEGDDQSGLRKFLSSSSKCDMTISVVGPR
uniref:Receptor-like serine/threonine-protein kinase n=1 Tax=Cannabis sativa TaxID=3483 RepID=A0A803PA77_CANSA